MKHLKLLLVVCFLFISFAWAQDQFNLEGTVINQADFPVDSLVVVLRDAGYADTTDVDGYFQVIGDATSIVSNHQEVLPATKFKGSNFIVPVMSGTQPVSVEVYNLKGSKVATVFNRTLPEGEHTIPILGNQAHRISQSVLIAVVKRGSDMSKFRIIKAGNSKFMVREFGSVSNASSMEKTARAVPVIDSLRFIRCITVEGEDEEFVEFTIPIEKLVDEFEVTLDLIPYEAIEWGKTQDGRGPQEVGIELKEQNIYPYDGYKYWGNSAWCSEFYSYILRVGGCPLGDDEGPEDEPNWLVDGWPSMITWFKNNAEYIEKSEIDAQNYLPNPGDFVQMSAHTTMVRYIEDDGTLHTLGGNEGNEVNLATRGNYKTFSSLNGYGRRSGITGNSYVSISE